MGTCIDAIFPRAIELDPEIIRLAIEASFKKLVEPLSILRELGHFSCHAGDWWVSWNELGIPQAIGEGPLGFSISVYQEVISFSNGERSWSIYSPESPIVVPLRQVICSVARDLGSGQELIIAAGGFGDTDHALDTAFDGGSFDDACRCMREHAGPPATSWKEWEAGENHWYLGPYEPY
jgi:hypothetical protein